MRSAGVLCAVAGPVDASSVKNIVRVHGACFDFSGLKLVDEMLVKRGYHVRVVHEPLASLKVASKRPSSPSSLVRASLWPTVTAAPSRPRPETRVSGG